MVKFLQNMHGKFAFPLHYTEHHSEYNNLCLKVHYVHTLLWCRGSLIWTRFFFYGWLTVLHRSISLIDLQLDAQNSYLFTYNTFIKILYMFRALPCSSSGGLCRNCVYMQPLVSSLSAGDCPVHQLRKNSFLTGAQDSHLQTVMIPEAAYIQLWCRPPEDEQGNARNM